MKLSRRIAVSLAVLSALLASIPEARASVDLSPVAGDNGPQIRNAITSLLITGGVINLAPGSYALDTPITVYSNITLRGTTPGPFDPINGQTPGSASGAAVLSITFSAAYPLTLSGSNSAIENILFYYPGQYGPTAAAPLNFPATIYITGGGNRVSACSFANSYVGVQVIAGRTRLERLNIGAFYQGVLVDGATDFVKITDLLMLPFWDTWNSTMFPALIDKWVYDHGYGIVVGRADGLTLTNISTLSKYAGLMLTKTGTVGPFGNATGLQFDGGQYGVIAFATDSDVGFSIANSYFSGYNVTQSTSVPQYGVLLLQGPGGSTALLSIAGGSIGSSHFVGRVQVNVGTLKTAGVLGVADGTITH